MPYFDYTSTDDGTELVSKPDLVKPDPEVEKQLLRCLCEVSLALPTTSAELAAAVAKQVNKNVPHISVSNLLQKFATQQLIG